MDILDGVVLDIHQVPNLQKVTIASLYLEPQRFVWYQWLCECKKNTIISWSIFTEELIAYHDDVKINSFFTQLINLWKKRSNNQAHSKISKVESQSGGHTR